MVALVLHHAGMEAVGLALDRPALRVEAAVADARMARHHAAQAGHRQAALPAVVLSSPSGVITGLTSTVSRHRRRVGVALVVR